MAERLRQRADLEHGAALPAPFDVPTDLVAEVGHGPAAPVTIRAPSDDAHRACVAEPDRSR
ncbi:hypothetical protein [Streptomyces sp. NPDC057702]|uniref:hypothetical protein n=1 Tax=unclassified Streptomyces TaxID=2593676 RepID=UPI0036BC10BC